MTDVTLGRSIGYAYDATGNRTSLSEGGVTYGYAYDVDGGLMQVTDGAGRKTAFKYDALGRRTEALRPNGIRTSYSYDAAHQVQDILHERGGVVLLGFRYGYDQFGNRISKKREDGTEETYGYDSDRRLTDAVYGGARSVTYTLDALGNRTAITETAVLSGGSTSTKSTSYSNNFFNQLVSRFSAGVTTAYAYDNNGNLLTETTGTQVKSYAWDLDNRLRQVVMPTSAAATYEYDANGLRTKKVEAGLTTKYLLEGRSVLAELDSANATTTRYLTSPQVIDEIVSFEQGGAASTRGGEAGSLNVFNPVSQDPRAVHDVNGERTASGTGPNIGYGFTGREHDAFTALNYHRDRYKDPIIGRWNQPDRLAMLAGPNFYSYVGAKPTRARDPSGMISTTFDTLFFVNLAAWIQIAQGIGMIAATAGAAAAAATFARAYVNTRDVDIVKACTKGRRQTKDRILWRGLSICDLNEFTGIGLVLSKFARRSGTLSDAISEGVMDSARAKAQDPSVAKKHMTKTSANSPWVSVTSSLIVAEGFADGSKGARSDPVGSCGY